MVSSDLRKAGLHHGTDRAYFVKKAFLPACDVDKLAVRVQNYGKCSDGGIVVHEGSNVELDDFGSFAEYAAWFVDGHPGSRFANPDERKTLILCAAHVDAAMSDVGKDCSPGQAAEALANPNLEMETMTEVYHNGGNRFTVYDDDTEAVFRVEMDRQSDNPTLVQLSDGEKVDVETDDEIRILRAVIQAGPEYREGPQEQLSVSVDASGSGGNAAGSGQSDGSGGSDSSPSSGDVVGDVTKDHNFDPEQLEENVSEWLEHQASDPSSDLIDGAWHVEFAQMNDPESGDSELGVFIRSDPWDGPHWDNDAGAFDTDDGSQPDEWADHSQSWRDLVQKDVVSGIAIDQEDSEYADWYNYIPATEAEEWG